MRVGSPVWSSVAPFPDEHFAGQVYFVAPTLDPASRRLLLKAWVANRDRRLRPGLFANIQLEVARRDNALVVPESALAYDADGAFVWRVGAGETAERVPVTIGIRETGRVEVVSGLAAGDRIVSAGTHKVGPGAVVRNVAPPPTAPAASGGEGGAVKLSQTCIERPVLATVMSLVIVLFGAIALPRLPNREFPDVDPPIVSVTTVLPGAAPEVVETSVTQPLEDQLIGIEGIRHLTSLSREQVSQITVEFDLDRNVDEAANDVRDRVARARGKLPDEVEEPVVAKSDADASPIIWMALSSERYGQLELSTLAETQHQGPARQAAGRVARSSSPASAATRCASGSTTSRLTAHNLTVADVAAALQRENVDMPVGPRRGRDREFTVRTLGELTTRRGVRRAGRRRASTARPVRLARRGAGRGRARGRPQVRALQRQAGGRRSASCKQSKANTLDVADAVAGRGRAARARAARRRRARQRPTTSRRSSSARSPT